MFWSSNVYWSQSTNVPLHCRGRLQLGCSCETKSLKSCWTTVGVVVISPVKEVGSSTRLTKLGSDESSWDAFPWDESMVSCNVKNRAHEVSYLERTNTSTKICFFYSKSSWRKISHTVLNNTNLELHLHHM